ncbi:hypothetical protein QBC44DRAFT_283171 [Cladorrhinum sp. PSN332]|nr:hypothetical protein QBC44DRAFT_283171 [Cladorrhinum sp. PSN332]
MWLDIPKPDYQRTRHGSFSDTDSPSIRSPDTDSWSASGKETSPIFNKTPVSAPIWEDQHDDVSDSCANPWRPFFLQRRALYGFMVIFILMGVAIEVLFIISEKRQGLKTAVSHVNLHYVWTYGPMVIMTLVSAFWAIVDFLSRVSVPWTRLREAKTELDIRKALLLDYISSFSFTVPFQALRNQDLVVASTTFISLLFTIMIIFAPSLIKFSPIGFKVPVELPTKFVQDPSRLHEYGVLPLVNAIGLKQYHLRYPAGISEGLMVYQSVQAPSVAGSEVHVTVEGLTNDLECQPATMTNFSTTAGRDTSGQFIMTLNFDLDAPGCNFVTSGRLFTLKSSTVYSDAVEKPLATQLTAGSVVTGQCKSDDGVVPDPADLDSWRLALVTLDLDVTLRTAGTWWERTKHTNITDTAVRTSQQLICKPTYSIIDVDVFQGGGDDFPRVVPAKTPQPRRLGDLHAWDIATAILNTYNDDRLVLWSILRTAFLGTIEEKWWEDSGWDRGVMNRQIDNLITAMLALGNASYPEERSIHNATALGFSARSFYRKEAAFLTRGTLMEQAVGVASGYATIPRDRFVVHSLTAHILAALCLLSALALWLVVVKLPKDFSLEGDPTTILGTKALAESFAHSFPEDLRGTGRLPEKADDVVSALAERDSKNNTPKFHQPLSVRLDSRAAVCLCLVGTIAVLEVLQRKAERDDGIGPYIPSLIYLHYSWTLLPTLAASLMGMFFVSVDSELRSLVPYHALSKGPTPPRESVGLNLRGLVGPHALLVELRTRHFTAAAATVAAMCAGLLGIVSGSLYFVNAKPHTSDQLLRLVGSFTSDMYNQYYTIYSGVSSSSGYSSAEASVVSTLLLQSNLSYPEFTYEDLAFPALALDGLKQSSNISELEIKTVVPALRGGLSCTLHSQGKVSADILHIDPVNVAGIKSLCPETYGMYGWDGSPELQATAVFHLPEQDDERVSEGVFAAVQPNSEHIGIFGCGSYFYVWGTYVRGANGKPGSARASALSCNGTVESIDVEATFWGPDLAIRPHKPPVPKRDTAHVIIEPSNQNSRTVFNASGYEGLRSFKLSHKGVVLDDFFSLLINSPRGLPLETLGDQESEQVKTVVDAIKYQHGIIMAQYLSTGSRIPTPGYYANASIVEHMNDKGVFERTGQGELNTTVYPASVYASTPRVMQDERSTRIMQGLLAAVLLFAALSWALAPKMAVLPRPATSLASILALLVDGNVYQKGEEGGESAGKDGSEDGRAYRLGIGTTRCPGGTAMMNAADAGDDKPLFAIWIVDTLKKGGDIELKGVTPQSAQ